MITEYLILLSQGKSFHPLKEKFSELGGFYNGIGYAFPLQKEEMLTQIVSALNPKILKMPLGIGQTFESLRQSFKSAFFKDNLSKKQLEILHYKNRYLLDDISEEILISSHIPELEKNKMIHLIHECEELEKSIAWADRMEKATSLLHNIPLTFVDEKTINYLIDEAPPVPRLINYMEDGKQKPFIRKGIVAMLVGAGGVGKTHALAQLAISIITGHPWFGKYPVEKTGYVFMGLGENTEEDIHRLLRKVVINQSKNHPFFDKSCLLESSKRLATMSFTGVDASFTQQGLPTKSYEMLLDGLKTREPEEGWACIIFDPISRFLGSDAETDNAEATRFIALLEKMIAELKGRPTIIFGHHMNKGGVGSSQTDQSAARGSSALTDGVRQQFNLERAKKESEEGENYEINVVNFRMVKSNFTTMLSHQKLMKDNFGCLHAIEENNKVISNSENIKNKRK
jgi:hypothetical protein